MGQNSHSRHTVKASLRAERSNLCPKTEIASSLTAPCNDSIAFFATLCGQGFVSRSLTAQYCLHLPFLATHPDRLAAGDLVIVTKQMQNAVNEKGLDLFS
jgi:hypothetical protein